MGKRGEEGGMKEERQDGWPLDLSRLHFHDRLKARQRPLGIPARERQLETR